MLVGQVVVPQLIVAYIVFVELIVEPVVALAALAESVVEQRVLLAVVMDSSQASHCSSARACTESAWSFLLVVLLRLYFRTRCGFSPPQKC